MVNKFLVCVVFAIVTPSSVLLSPVTFNGFSEEGYALLEQLQSEDLAARERSVTGFSLFIFLLENGTRDTSHHQDLSPFTESLIIAAEATDIIYHSALLAGHGDCDGIDIALNQSHAQLQGVIEALVSSVALARGAGNYDNSTRHEIENNRNLTQAGLISAYATLFDFLRCCIGDSSDEFENLLEAVEAKVNLNYVLISNALYEAIEAYSILTSECTEDKAAAALLSIEKSRWIITSSAVDNVQHMFTLYETSWILAQVNCEYIAHGVFEIRLARKRTSDKLEEVVKVVFLAITGRLLQHTSHNETESRNSTLDDPTRAIAVGLILGAEEHFLQAVLRTLPNSVDDAIVARMIFPHILSKIIGHYYNGMDLAEADSFSYHLSLSTIKSVEVLQSLMTNFVVKTCFKIIGSNTHTEARLAKMQNRVTVSLQEANEAIFDAIKVLSKAAHASGGATEDNFEQVNLDLSIAIAAVSNAAKVQLHAVLYKYLAEKKC